QLGEVEREVRRKDGRTERRRGGAEIAPFRLSVLPSFRPLRTRASASRQNLCARSPAGRTRPPAPHNTASAGGRGSWRGAGGSRGPPPPAPCRGAGRRRRRP